LKAKNEVRTGIPETNQPTPIDVPIGIDRGKSPLESLPETISAAEIAKKGGADK